MSSDSAIELHGVSKRYRLGVTGSQGFTRWGNLLTQRTTMASVFLKWARHPLTRAQPDWFWAVKDIDFELKEGEVLGLVGRNGAGKSTLLKLIARITDITEGRIELYGRVGSLLEVGTGFHPELTGRENIYLNGSILGMRRKEIDSQFDAIVDFADVETFLDTPVKRFSSGMNVRLAFSIAAHLRTEILLVDEVLAVGDKMFRDKCLGKLSSVADSGRTVIYVSHLMETVTQLCTQAVLLDKGRMTMHGTVDEVVTAYLVRQSVEADLRADMDVRPGMGAFRFVEAEPEEGLFSCDGEKVIFFTVERRDPTFADYFYVNAQIIDEREVVVASCNSRLVNHEIHAGQQHHGLLRLRTPWLKPGRYRVDLSLEHRSGLPIDEAVGACFIEVGLKLPYPGAPNQALTMGAVFPDFSFESLEGNGAASGTSSRKAAARLEHHESALQTSPFGLKSD